ncbi:MAG: PDZ domain-containing protein [Planctomycetota bacterium]|nr:PDZ domain-containing protein [Planctomycetota bacterium]MDA1112984.1 PDZ domain-containing protein [Planctomycetota bacterium]
MIGTLALSIFLFAQESKPPEFQQDAEVLVVDVASPLTGEWQAQVQIESKGVLEQLDEELIELYSALRPSLVEVHFLLSQGTDAERLLVASGVVLNNYGLVVVPIIVDGHHRNGILSEIRVTRVDSAVFPAELLGQNEAYGISLLRAPELRGLAPKFWNGTWMQEGASVVSLGNGFGFQSSMHFGMVSGRGRIIKDAVGLLQITNPVNLADSGGLLANRRGEVVGVLMTSLAGLVHQREVQNPERKELGFGATEAKRAEGVSFAIPIEFVFQSFPEHFPSKESIRLMGVMVSSEIRVVEEEGEEPSYVWQLRLISVDPGSPADRAGMKPNDVVLSLNDQATRNLQDLGQAIHDSPLSTMAVVLRGDQRLVLPLEFAN